MRIGFDAKRAFNNFRGLGNYSRTLIEGLIKYENFDSVFLYTPKVRHREFKNWIDSQNQIHLKMPKRIIDKSIKSFWRSFSIGNDIISDKLDIFHGLSHEIPLNSKLWSKNTKSIVSIHDLIFMRFPEFYPVLDRMIYYKKIQSSCSSATKILAICDQTKNDLIDFLGVPEEKIEVIYQSCNPSFYKEIEQNKILEILSKYGLRQNYILNVGAIEDRKNTIRLIQAYANSKSKSDYNLVIVSNSKGDYRVEVERFIEKNKLSKNIKIIENVNSSDLPAIYQGANLFCFPSLFEGFGIPIVESLFSKTPVITSKGSCFPESAGPKSCYVDPLNFEELSFNIDRILSSDEIQSEMISNGYDFVQKFHLKNTSKNLFDFYSKTLKN